MIEIKDLKEEISTFVKKAQTRIDELNERGSKTDEGLEALKGEFVKKSEEFQVMADQIRAAEEERKQLEALMARIPTATERKGEELGSPEYRKGFRNYLRNPNLRMEEGITKQNVIELLAQGGVKAEGEELETLMVKAGLFGSNPDGGFFAPVDMARGVSTRVFETSPVRAVANVITTGMGSLTWIIDDQEAGSGWVGEVDARPDTTTPQYAEETIEIHEIYAKPKISQKAIDDLSLSLESLFQENVARRFARQENAAFISGTGVKQPKGILTYPSWGTQGEYERYALEHRDTATVGTIAGDDFIDVQSDLLEDYQANASWMMHRKVWAEVVQLKDTDGQYLLNPMMLFSGVDMQLLGKPVRFAGDMSSTITEGASIAIYGNFREGYVIADRIGIRVLRDPYTDKPFVQLYTTKRVGGAVVNFQALKVLDVQAS